MTPPRDLDHALTGSRSAWCHRCKTVCADRMYARPDLGPCDCCKGEAP